MDGNMLKAHEIYCISTLHASAALGMNDGAWLHIWSKCLYIVCNDPTNNSSYRELIGVTDLLVSDWNCETTPLF